MPDVDSKGCNHANQRYFADSNRDDDISLPIDDNRSNLHLFLGHQRVGNR